VTETVDRVPGAAVAAQGRASSPYQGLRPYEEADAAFFFGREAEGENVEANLFSDRLTLLYGPSGVGKSSVLLAGVAGSLRRRSRDDLADGAAAGFAVIVVRSWSEADPLQTIAAATRAEVTALLGRDGRSGPPAGATLAEVLDYWCGEVRGKLLLLFDQFEEYFLYHGKESGPGTFDREFPQAVNRADLRANFLLSIRDDALAQLDRFKGRIPGLFDNRLQIDHLGLDAARDAVTLPIEEYNRHVAPDQAVEIEDELVDDVLDQVRTDRVSRESLGAGALRQGVAAEARVETPILQVVLTALWEREAELGSRTLRAETLRDDLGGAAQLLGDRLNDRMAKLGGEEQEIAASIARFLVTPSGTKIALTAADLSQLAYEKPDLAAAATAQVESVLQKLAEGDTRFLRPVAPLAGRGATRYELFHDVLAAPILEWRKQHEQRADEERQRAARRRLVLRGTVAAVLALVFAAVAALAFWLLHQQNVSNSHLRAFRRQQLASIAKGKKGQKQLHATVVQLRGTNVSLTADTTGLKRRRIRLDRGIRRLRATNRKLVREIDRLNIADATLAKKIDSLRHSYRTQKNLEAQLAADRSGLQHNTKTLKAENRALKAQLDTLNTQYTRLVARARLLGLPIPPLSANKSEGLAPQPPPLIPTQASQFLVPGDVAGSDKLRREVERLDAQLRKRLEARAKAKDEAKWLRVTNKLLVRQRKLLRAEVGHLEGTRSALSLRERKLRRTDARAVAENRQLSSRAGPLEARDTKERKQIKKQQTANADLQGANNSKIDHMASVQKEIGSQRSRNKALAKEFKTPLGTVLQGAGGLPDDPVVAALLAVDGYLVAPYQPDDPANPAVLNAMWLALTQLNPTAAQNLKKAPRSALLKSTLCTLAKRPLTSDELSQLRGYLPPGASSTLQHPCG
jgi:hypothetical protein